MSGGRTKEPLACSQPHSRPTAAQEARPLAHGCPLGPREESPSRVGAEEGLLARTSSNVAGIHLRGVPHTTTTATTKTTAAAAATITSTSSGPILRVARSHGLFPSLQERSRSRAALCRPRHIYVPDIHVYGHLACFVRPRHSVIPYYIACPAYHSMSYLCR